MKRKYLFAKFQVEAKKITTRHLSNVRQKTGAGMFTQLFSGYIRDQFVECTGAIKTLRKINILSKWRRQQNWDMEIDLE